MPKAGPDNLDDPYFNPYAAPQTSAVPLKTDGSLMWADGWKLVLLEGAVLPDNCVRCFAPAEGYRLKRNFSWHHPAIAIAILFSLPIYIILALVMRKRFRVDVPLCLRHRSRRVRGIAIGWVVALLGVAMLVLCATLSDPYSMICLFGGIAMLLGGLIGGAIMAQTLTPTKIETGRAWFKGASPDLLAGLPDWAGSR